MGRYAFFNTGFEYKFGFAIQESGDIALFSGIDTSTEDGPAHAWSAEHAPSVWSNLELLRRVLQLPSIAWSDFPKTAEGTEQLRKHVQETVLSEGAKPLHFRYYLGALIYHQLLYTDPLTVSYEQ